MSTRLPHARIPCTPLTTLFLNDRYKTGGGRDFTTRENLVAFVKVNLDDDLYYQARAWYVHMQRVRSVRIMAHGVHMDCT